MKEDEYPPHLMIIAGSNGTGKTTVGRKILKDYPQFGINIFLDADEIARSLSPHNPSSQSIEAGKFIIQKRNELLEERKNFAFETTLSGHQEIKIIQKAKEQGYLVTMMYLYTTDVEINIQRIKMRVLQNGHDVPSLFGGAM